MTGSTLRLFSRLMERHLIWVLLIVLVAFGLTVQGFASVQNIMNVLWAAAPLGWAVGRM